MLPVHVYLRMLKRRFKFNKNTFAVPLIRKSNSFAIPAIANIKLCAAEIRQAEGVGQPDGVPRRIGKIHSFRTGMIAECKFPVAINVQARAYNDVLFVAISGWGGKVPAEPLDNDIAELPVGTV